MWLPMADLLRLTASLPRALPAGASWQSHGPETMRVSIEISQRAS
jgi:hypothetical protein